MTEIKKVEKTIYMVNEMEFETLELANRYLRVSSIEPVIKNRLDPYIDANGYLPSMDCFFLANILDTCGFELIVKEK